MSLRRSLRTTSAARSMSERLVPWAIAATVPIEHGQITIPAVFADPDAGSAPRSVSSNTRTLVHSPPVACLSARSSGMPHSSVRSRQPWLETRSQVGTWCTASISSSRTPYGAPEAPVMAKITGNRFNAPSDSESDCAWGARAGGGAAAIADCGFRIADWNGRVASRHDLAVPFRNPQSAIRNSQHPIHEGAKEHDDADNAIGGGKGRIEPRQDPPRGEPQRPPAPGGPDGGARGLFAPQVGHRPRPPPTGERPARQPLGHPG